MIDFGDSFPSRVRRWLDNVAPLLPEDALYGPYNDAESGESGVAIVIAANSLTDLSRPLTEEEVTELKALLIAASPEICPDPDRVITWVRTLGKDSK